MRKKRIDFIGITFACYKLIFFLKQNSLIFCYFISQTILEWNETIKILTCAFPYYVPKNM